MNLTLSQTPATSTAVAPVPVSGAIWGAGSACRLCSFKLKREDGDDFVHGLCASCKSDPEAEVLMQRSALSEPIQQPVRSPFSNMVAAVTGEALPIPPRTFNDADLALIRRMGAFMPEEKLLEVLNERLACDLGTDTERYTLEQLTAAITDLHGEKNPAALGRDWPSLRKLLAQARRSGVLDQVNDQVIDDFAVVFQLNAKQVVELKDILISAQEE